jgi:hypothetical protein
VQEAPIATSLEALRSKGEDHLGYCAGGLRRSGDAAIDLLRLGALCGPANGLLPYEPAFEAVVDGNPVRRTFELKRRQCVRLGIVSEQTGKPVRVTLQPVGSTVGAVKCTEAFGWCPPASAYCPGGERVELEISALDPVKLSARLWVLTP